MSRRKTVRVDEHDGPWSVSVAENQPSNNYSLYIQTPTHLLTLTRSASEIAELHAKLVQTDIPSLPALPLDSTYQSVSTKRRSSFLTTLSRLAAGNNPNNISNSNNNTPTKQPLSPTSPRPSIGQYPTPAVSPENDIDDPFTVPVSSPNTNTTSTGLAAYLTAVSNHPTVRTARAWRRFVRVRTDDLESVRVERSIKRVRSDVAMHHPQPTTQSLMAMAPMLATDSSSVPVSDVESTHTQDPDVNSKLYGHIVHSVAESIGTGGGPASVAGSMHDLKEEEEDDDMLRMREDAKIAELIAAGQLASTPLDIPARLPPTVASATIDTTTVVDTPIPISASSSFPISTSQTGAPILPPVQLIDASDLLPTPSPSPPTPTPQSSADVTLNTKTTTITTAAVVGHRIPRSASADPDKASRLSRAWVQEQEEQENEVKLKKRSLTPKASPSSRSAHKSKRTTVDDFEMMRVLGKGCAGKVLLVKHKASGALYALKAITKRHVLAHQELQHTLTEQAVLKRMTHEAADPFVVKLWWSFHDKENLFLVMDFHPGGDLATQLARWGRLGRDRARFYAAEIVEGVEGLHAAGVVYRDLKPENILIGADGHIVLTDFGLSKEFPRRNVAGITGKAVSPSWIHAGSRGEASTRSASASSSGSATWIAGRDMTTTFCGTAEYLAPEVIQGLPYSYEVDWWSFGTMLYEMLTGITPFWANNHSDMYVRVLQDELQFPDDKAMDQDTKSLIRGLLQRNPALRMSEPRLKRHPYFSMIDWSHVYYKRYIPPYIPPIDPSNASDTQNFDEAFLDMDPTLDNDEDEDADGDVSRSRDGSPPPLQKTKTKALTHRIGDESDADVEDEPGDVDEEDEKEEKGEQANGAQDETDVFDGYSFKGRISVIIDDDVELDGVERSSESEAEGEEEEESIKDVSATVQQEALGEINVDAVELVPDDSAAVIGASRPAPIEEEAEVEAAKAPEVQEIEVREMQTEIQATPVSLKPSLGHSVASEDVVASELEQKQDIRDAEPSQNDEVELPPVPVETKAIDPDTVTAVSSTTPAPVGRPASVFVEGLSENDIAAQSIKAEAETPAPAVPSKDVPASAIATAASTATAVVGPTLVPMTVPAPPPKTAMRQPATDSMNATTSGGLPKPAKAVTIAAPPSRGLRQALAFGKSTATSTSISKPSVEMSDDEDEDWDFVENPGGEDRNGARGTSLFARGVVDRYRLAVFRKSSSSGGAGGYPSGQQGQRVASTASRSSATAEVSDVGSPESSEKRRGRGRLGKSTRTFLRARSPALTPAAVPASPVPVHAVSSSGTPTLGSLGLTSNSSRLRSSKNGHGNGYPNLGFNGKRSVSAATGSSASALGSLIIGSGSGTGTGGPDTSSASIANTSTTAATTMTTTTTTIPQAGPSLKSKDSSMSMSPSGISGSGSSSVDVDGELGMSTAYSGGVGATDTSGTTYTTTTTTSVSVSVSARTSGIRIHDLPRTPSLPVPHPESGYLSSGDTSTGGGGHGIGGGLFGIGKRINTSSMSPMSHAGEEGKKKKMKKYKEGAEKVLSLFGSPRQDKERERERIAAERRAQILLQQQQLNLESTSTPTQTQAFSIPTPPSPIPQTQTPIQMQHLEHMTETQS